MRERLAGIVGAWNCSQLAPGPAEALEAIERLPHKDGSEERVVYVISDFRTNQWDDPADIRPTLARLEQQGARLQLVDCVDATHPNLAISDLSVASGVCAAGVPLWMELTVTNYASATAAHDVSVTLAEDGLARPAVVIQQIPAGKSVTRRFPVVFTAAGQHRVSAQLDSDAVTADNVRYAVVEVTATAPVLIVDGDPQANDAFFLSTALSPGGKVKSGISPLIESPRFLREHALDGYDAIFLLNFDRLDQTEIAALEAYVRAGGGVGIFLGELSQADFINKQLYRDGEGLFPLPLVGITELLVDRNEQVPDVEVTDHPIFSVFAGQRNSFIGTILVEHYFAAPKNWTPPADSTTEVIARLRNGAPLAVEGHFWRRPRRRLSDQGRAGRNAARRLEQLGTQQSQLRRGHARTASLSRPPAGKRVVTSLVGAPLTSATCYAGRISAAGPASLCLAGATSVAVARLSVDAEPSATELTAVLGDTAAAGIYEAQWAQRSSGEIVTREFALNVDPREGNLDRLGLTSAWPTGSARHQIFVSASRRTSFPTAMPPGRAESGPVFHVAVDHRASGRAGVGLFGELPSGSSGAVA